MTFPLLAIPNPGDIPSQSQSQLQTNFNSIISWAAIDHVGFGTTNSGTHNQITFSSLTAPSTPSNPTSILYTKNDAFSVPQLFYLNSLNSNYYSAASTGTTVLLGGIIMKWGSKPAGATGTNITVNFTSLGIQAFPHGCFVAFAIGNSNGRIYNTTINSTAQITVSANTSLASSDNFFWLALGN